MPEEKTQPSTSSRRGLDWINFLAADVQSGVGPYLTIFLTAHGWIASWLGVALAASAAASALVQIPAGWAVDRLACKRGLIVGAGAVIAVSCLVTVWWPDFWPVIFAQAALGVAAAILMPAIAATTLGLVGPKAMASRTSRNETLNHAGSFLTALIAGTIGQMLGLDWIFYLVCAAAIGSAVATSAIRSNEIDQDMASGGAAGGAKMPLDKLFHRPALLLFLCTVFLFQCGNGGMLSLASRELAVVHPKQETWLLTACILGAQASMTGVAWLVGRGLHKGYGRRTILLSALLFVPLRGILFAWATYGDGINGITIVAIQMLDGFATGTLSVVSTVMAADITRGTGRFNFTIGMVALTIAAGSAGSNVIGGFVTQHWGVPYAFLVLAAIAVLGIGTVSGMAETRPEENEAARKSAA
ncbi:MFS transporter [Kozakia baliensis]|uniref:MFS transporter n=1 Tax=Kozakia baliensis TaxID=153496 RepID=UPI00087A3E63|nr:MFS transporter [Kozakia baliensis]AOX20342.1 hypothetical protein A0U90_08560 [Kozakia baliensis]